MTLQETQKQINTMRKFVEHDYLDLLGSSITMVDFDTIANSLLENEFNITNEELEPLIYDFVEILKYIEEETEFESVLDDETYDKLIEKYHDMTGKRVTGSDINVSSNRPMRTHKYPELVGTLDKVHFIRKSEIPKGDSRKSLEDWLQSINKKYDLFKKNQFIVFNYNFKYDGLSCVLECDNGIVEHAVTRRDTEASIGQDVSHIFAGKSVEELFPNAPEELYTEPCGIKVEVIMTSEHFEQFSKTYGLDVKHRRSAVTKIMNTLKESYNPDWFQYLTFPLLQFVLERPAHEQTSSEDPISNYMHCGAIGNNNRHMYVTKVTIEGMHHNSPTIYEIDSKDIWIEQEYRNRIIQEEAEKLGIPIDGCVITFTNPDIIQNLGRKDSINKFQVAFKFPAGKMETELEDVEFPVGPVAGNVTPLAIIKPIKIGGSTINKIGLSNYAKLEKLKLSKGDRVMVQYDIIPKMVQNISAEQDKRESGDIHPPIECPVCGEPLQIQNGVARCMNYDCGSKIVGKICNYLSKIGADGIGESTVSALVADRILTSIGDLYRIPDHEAEIVEMVGFGQKSYDNIIKSIFSHSTLYPHELLGSLGIPDIGRRIMKKVCQVISIGDLLSDDPEIVTRMTNIKGIGDATATKICEGILRNRDTINDILNYVIIRPYEETPKNPDYVVLFTGVRNAEFADFLVTKCNCEIAGSMTKKVNLLIYKGTTRKVETAKERGIETLTLDEAKKKFNYEVQ